MNELHSIDKNGNYNEEELEKFLIFCLLDRAMPYKNVCKVFDGLTELGITNKGKLKKLGIEEISRILSWYGHRFPNQTAKYLKHFAHNDINLETCTREEMVEKIDGIGYKLASMFLRNTRGENYAVLDTHIKKWLKEMGFEGKNYIESEKNFLEICKEVNMTPYELDMLIWEDKRRK